MNNRKLLAVVVCVLLAVAAFTVSAETAEGITVTDMLGRDITLDAPAGKVVVLMPADAEILYALGASDRIVGVGTYCAAAPEPEVMPGIDQLPVVDSGYVTNVEEILKLEPQLVILTKMGHSEELVDALAKGGVQVAVTDAQDLEGVYTDITLLGALTGKEAEAEQLIASMKQKFEEISAKAGETGKTLYVEESPLQWGLWAAGTGTYMDDLAAICGMTNIFADLEGHQAVSEEQVLERNPDVIITMTMYYGEGDLPDAEIMGRTGWENVSAVQSGSVIYDPTNAIALPGPRLTEVAEMLLEKLQADDAAEPAA